MTGGNTRSKTSSGASSSVGKPGTSARATPVSTKRMADGILSRAATSATAATTTSSDTRIWIVGIMSTPVGNDGRTRAQVPVHRSLLAAFMIDGGFLDKDCPHRAEHRVPGNQGRRLLP